MVETTAIAKINRRHNIATQHGLPPTCPHFLWAKLWITMFTSCTGRANTGLRQDAFEMTSSRDTATMQTLRNLQTTYTMMNIDQQENT